RAAVFQSFGGSNVTRPERVKPAVPSERIGSGFHAVGLPAASTALAYSSTPRPPALAPALRVKVISRNFSRWPSATDSRAPPNVRSPAPLVWAAEVRFARPVVADEPPRVTFRNHVTGVDDGLSPVHGVAWAAW